MNTYRIHALIYEKVLKFSYICNIYLKDKLIIWQYLQVKEIVHWLFEWPQRAGGFRHLMEIPQQLQVSKNLKKKGWGFQTLDGHIVVGKQKLEKKREGKGGGGYEGFKSEKLLQQIAHRNSTRSRRQKQKHQSPQKISSTCGKSSSCTSYKFSRSNMLKSSDHITPRNKIGK